MPLEARLLTSLALAMALVYWGTPLAIRLAGRLNFYDRPAGYKGHGRPTPYLGGTAVILGFALAVSPWSVDAQRTLPLLAGVLVLWVLGTVDDRRHVAPGLRVVVETALAGGLWALGHGWETGQGAAIDLALTILWVVAVVNAFNLFDNMDGAATTMVVVVAGAVSILGLVTNDLWLSIVSIGLCGACIGFLPHNLASPAKIFLGDGGSMPLGFAVATLTMMGAGSATSEWYGLALGLLLVGVPALDTALVVVSRTRRGISVLTGGRDHLTHRSLARFRTARAVAMALGCVQALIAALALVAVEGGSSALFVAVIVYLVGIGTAIALLDRGVEATEAAAGPVAPPRAAATRAVPAEAWLLAGLGLLVGASPFFSGYYDTSFWVPGGLALLFILMAAVIARPARLRAPAALALAGTGGLAALSLASMAWGDSAAQAATEGDRLLVYALFLGVVFLLVRSRRSALWLYGALTLGAVAVAASVLVRMLGDDPNSLFIAGRLDKPLGYINGEASFMLLGLWLCLAVAEQRRHAWLSGLALSAATVFGGLLALSQSRGAVLALAASALIVLALVPGRLRRASLMLVLGGALALASGPLLEVYDAGRSGGVPDGVARSAALALLLAAAAAGLVAGLATAAEARLSGDASQRLRAVLAAGFAGLALLVAAAGVVKAGTVSSTLRAQYDSFVNVSQVAGSDVPGTRLATGAGTRYDYWRIAWGAWKDKPLLGLGAGNYDAVYFRERTTPEDVRQPHSLPLQTLSELGLAGLAALLLLLAGLALGAWRARAAAAASRHSRLIVAGGVGVTSAWLVHTSVDWIHLLPGVTGIALAGAALVIREGGAVAAAGAGASQRRALLPRPVAATLVASALVITGVLLSRQGLSEVFRDRASAAVAERPADAIREADRALRIDPDTLDAYYLKAAGLARFGEADAAERVLRAAAAREPQDFVTYALLGDLAVRRGRLDEARTAYARAAALNPRDAGLQRLAADPASASALLDPGAG